MAQDVIEILSSSESDSDSEVEFLGEITAGAASGKGRSLGTKQSCDVPTKRQRLAEGSAGNSGTQLGTMPQAAPVNQKGSAALSYFQQSRQGPN